MLIKMLCGVCSVIEEGIVIAKTNKSEAFYVEEKRGRELIEAGYAYEVRGTCHLENNVSAGAKDTGRNKASAEDYSLQELRNLAKEMGLPAGGSKTELFNRIEAAKGYEETAPEMEDTENTDVDEDAEESPLLTAAEPEA